MDRGSGEKFGTVIIKNLVYRTKRKKFWGEEGTTMVKKKLAQRLHCWAGGYLEANGG